jgi:hypothetical protein
MHGIVPGWLLALTAIATAFAVSPYVAWRRRAAARATAAAPSA